MRLFLAIDLDEKARKAISGIVNQLKKGDFDVKWVTPDNIHITLKFLGEVRDEHASDVVGKITDAVKDVKKFKISIEGVGYFGSPNFIRVIWVDVKEGRGDLISLCKTMNKELSHVRREDHEPSPHITIGRVRSGKNVDMLVKDIGELKHVKLCELGVNEIKLKSSVLQKDGPMYSDLEVFTLQ